MATEMFSIPIHPGYPAITPTIFVDDPRVPSYTITDARAYMESHVI